MYNSYSGWTKYLFLKCAYFPQIDLIKEGIGILNVIECCSKMVVPDSQYEELLEKLLHALVTHLPLKHSPLWTLEIPALCWWRKKVITTYSIYSFSLDTCCSEGGVWRWGSLLIIVWELGKNGTYKQYCSC